MRFHIIPLIILLSSSLTIGQNVGINTPNPEGTVHISGHSSIMFPNLRITDTVDNFARIKFENTASMPHFWDIAASGTPGLSLFNVFFHNPGVAQADLFQINGETGVLTNRAIADSCYTQFYTGVTTYRGLSGFVGDHMLFQSANNLGNINFGTRNTVNMTLDTIGRLGLGTESPRFLADFRGSDDTYFGGELQLSTPNETNFLRFFGGRQGDPHPFIAFHELDTFHLVTTSADFSTYKQRLTMLPNGFVGLGTSTPSVELDIKSQDADEGVEFHMSNQDTTHFLRLYSGKQSVTTPIISWRHGDVLEMGMVQVDGNNYRRFLSFNGKTIGVHNTGESIYIGEDAGLNDYYPSSHNVGIGMLALRDNMDGRFNTALGHSALRENVTGEGNVAVGASALEHNTAWSNVGVGTAALANNTSGGHNVAIGYKAGIATTTGSSNVVIGANTMYDNTTGGTNVAIGTETMGKNSTGGGNTAVGWYAMHHNISGLRNTVLGREAGSGMEDQSFSGNVLLGYQAGQHITASDRLYIENSSSTSPLIYGEFDNNLIRVNGRQEITGDLTLGTAFFIDQSEKRIGVNTVAPSYTLDVNGTVNLNKNISSGVAMRVNGDEALWYNENYFSWGFGADHNYSGRPMTIGPFEGSTTPFAQLHVIDDGFTYLQVESLDGDAILQLSGNTNSPSIGWTMRRDASDGGKLQWRHDDYIKMTMTPSGDLGIGLTAPTYQLHLSSDSAGKPGGGSWTNSSDRRLKQNINHYKDGLAEIEKIRPVTFHYNETSGYDTIPEYVGVIAQELQEVAPYMVSENEKGYLDVNNSAMTYMLVNALQEQQEMIKVLQAEVNMLKLQMKHVEVTDISNKNTQTASIQKKN